MEGALHTRHGRSRLSLIMNLKEASKSERRTEEGLALTARRKLERTTGAMKPEQWVEEEY